MMADSTYVADTGIAFGFRGIRIEVQSHQKAREPRLHNDRGDETPVHTVADIDLGRVTLNAMVLADHLVDALEQRI
jgi:hypothetical protein